MSIEEITAYISSSFEDVNVTEANNDLFFFYREEKMMPFATIVTSDNDFDNASQLNRKGFFRLNIGIDKTNFITEFNDIELKKGIGAYLNSGLDFSVENVLMPHPVYCAMYWVCIVNPHKENMLKLKPHLDVAYSIAVKRQNKA
ncbi:DUF6194 family protein [Pedobacter heparinus]|uniref:DUF6194 domain-containing protein n=1 Tax=Pedobacter heparinus (strain ATCC 13125 / DSM 2366 / CIP 104194 / JCM 7457 / NBRC 12017 / NCIMB 9290 / NRRL B-14731 / HIM 762-3) TaxID=485917 RepID=C6XYW3_PEDHD|nr:DUF6194 family protein [Pedobacter heparinus]ACU04595.1 hypothetical protein Phep_2391 [Pedobacter heparinus DSM 2366]